MILAELATPDLLYFEKKKEYDLIITMQEATNKIGSDSNYIVDMLM